MSNTLTLVFETTKTLEKMGLENGEGAYLASASIYLEMFGFFIVGWTWLAQSMVVREQLCKKRLKKSDKLFYEGKIKVQAYYFANELPKIYSLSRILTRQLPVTISTDAEHFTN